MVVALFRLVEVGVASSGKGFCDGELLTQGEEIRGLTLVRVSAPAGDFVVLASEDNGVSF